MGYVQAADKITSIGKYNIINYIISHDEYFEVHDYLQTFFVLDMPALNLIERYVMYHTKAQFFINKNITRKTVVNALMRISSLSPTQIDVIFHNIDTIGKYIIPVLLSDNRVNIIFVEKS